MNFQVDYYISLYQLINIIDFQVILVSYLRGCYHWDTNKQELFKVLFGILLLKWLPFNCIILNNFVKFKLFEKI